MSFLKLKSGITSSIFIASVFLSVANQANAAYTFTDLGSLGTYSGLISTANAINNLGQVVGSSEDDNLDTHATLWSKGTTTDLGTLKDGVFSGKNSYATDINDSGQIAGHSFTFSSEHAVKWQGTTLIDLGQPVANVVGNKSFAFGINNSGQVVGRAGKSGVDFNATQWDSNGTPSALNGFGAGGDSQSHAINSAGTVVGVAFLRADDQVSRATSWKNGITTDLGTLGGTVSSAAAINATEQIVGYSETSIASVKFPGAFEIHATLWDGAAKIDLGTLGGSSIAHSINATGQVVGYSELSSAQFSGLTATLWENGKIINLNSLLDAATVNAGWVLEQANDINDSGWIVGQAYNNGVRHAFLLSITPVPEPESYAMLMLGLVLIGFMAKRSRVSMA